MDVTVPPTLGDLALLVEALDAYAYWEAGDVLPRNNGSVFIPGDLRPEDDRYWRPSPSPDDAQLEAIERVEPAGTLLTGWRPSVTSSPIDTATLSGEVCMLCVWPAGTSASQMTSTSRLGALG